MAPAVVEAIMLIEPTPMVLDGLAVGVHASTMMLVSEGDGVTYLIKWDIPGLDRTEHIGLKVLAGEVEDYDGVCSLPQEAVAFLRAHGFRVPSDLAGEQGDAA